MNIRLYIYNGEVAWARLTVNDILHIAADCRTFGRHKTDQTIEITTSRTTEVENPSNAAMIGMCERDVKQGYARAIDLDVEPTEKDWPGWGISSTVVPFDYNLLKSPV